MGTEWHGFVVATDTVEDPALVPRFLPQFNVHRRLGGGLRVCGGQFGIVLRRLVRGTLVGRNVPGRASSQGPELDYFGNETGSLFGSK